MNGREYHVMNKRYLRQVVTPHSPNEHQIFSECLTKQMKDKKARAVTKLFTYLRETVDKQPGKEYSHEDLAIIIRDAIAMQAKEFNSERDQLIGQLELIEEILQPLDAEVNNCLEDASIKSIKYGTLFTTIMCLQFGLVQYGTYVAFSWDIMEPITCCMTLLDAIYCYFFWLYCGKPWDLDGIR